MLPAAALVPEGQLVEHKGQPTHRMRVQQAFHFEVPSRGRRPAGRLEAGAAVRLLDSQGRWARVVDERGLVVFTALGGLEALS